MAKKTVILVAPRLHEPSLESQLLSELEMETEIDLCDLCLNGVATGDAGGGRFSQIKFEKARLGAVSWRRAHFEDTIWDGCDLANADWREVFTSRVELLGCRAVGLQSPESNWRDVIFRDGNYTMSQFRFAKFERVRFENLDLREADFQNADLRGAVFQNCDLRESQFSFARLQNADFRSCQTEDMVIEASALSGLIVSPLQAAQFAKILGLQVRWDEGDKN